MWGSTSSRASWSLRARSTSSQNVGSGARNQIGNVDAGVHAVPICFGCDDRHLQCGGGALGPLTLHLEPMPLLARVVAVLNSMELAGSSRCSRREGQYWYSTIGVVQERPAGHTTSGCASAHRGPWGGSCGGSRSTWSRCLAFAAVASYLLRNVGQWRPRCCERVTRGAGHLDCGIAPGQREDYHMHIYIYMHTLFISIIEAASCIQPYPRGSVPCHVARTHRSILKSKEST